MRINLGKTKEVLTEELEDSEEESWRYGYNSVELHEGSVVTDVALDWPEEESSSEGEQLEIEAVTSYTEQQFEELVATNSLERAPDVEEIIIEEAIEEEPQNMVHLDEEKVISMQAVEERRSLRSMMGGLWGSHKEEIVESVEMEEETVRLIEPKIEEEITTATIPEASRRVLPSEPGMSFEENLRRRFGGNIRSALGSGTVVEGRFSFDEPVRIDGVLTGEVHSTSALIVGENAVVNANIHVGSLILLGTVTGPVIASDLIEVRRGGVLEGKVQTERIAIEDGGRFSGTCNLS